MLPDPSQYHYSSNGPVEGVIPLDSLGNKYVNETVGSNDEVPNPLGWSWTYWVSQGGWDPTGTFSTDNPQTGTVNPGDLYPGTWYLGISCFSKSTGLADNYWDVPITLQASSSSPSDFTWVVGSSLSGSLTTINSSADPVHAGQSVVYTASIQPVPSGGTASFSDGGTLIPGCGSQPVNADGTATCSVSYPSIGVHSIAASFIGYGGVPASVSVAYPETVNEPASTVVSLGLLNPSSMVVDNARDHLFISGTTSNEIEVLDFSGHLISTIQGEQDVTDMIVVGSTLYVACAGNGEIDEINLATLTKTTLATGIENLNTIAFAGGRLWVPTNSPGDFTSDALDAIDPDTAMMQTFSAAYYPGYPEVSASPLFPSYLYLTEIGVTPSEILRVDVSSGAPEVVATSSTTDQFALVPYGAAQISADGMSLIVNGYYGLLSFDPVSLQYLGAANGQGYPVASFDTCVSENVDLNALAQDDPTSGGPSVAIYPSTSSSPLLRADSARASIVRLSGQCSSLFAVVPGATPQFADSLYIIPVPSAPPAEVPEGPVTILFPLAGAGVVGAGIGIRQRLTSRRRST